MRRRVSPSAILSFFPMSAFIEVEPFEFTCSRPSVFAPSRDVGRGQRGPQQDGNAESTRRRVEKRTERRRIGWHYDLAGSVLPHLPVAATTCGRHIGLGGATLRRGRSQFGSVARAPVEALVWHGKNDIRCDAVPGPAIKGGRDAIIKVRPVRSAAPTCISLMASSRR